MANKQDDIAALKQLVEFLMGSAMCAGYGASYFSRAHRRMLAQALVSYAEQGEDLLSLARALAASDAAGMTPTAGTGGPSTSEPSQIPPSFL